jgi:uncharacterized protein YjdB
MYTVLNYTYPTVDTGTIYKLNYLELNEYIASGIPSVRVRLGAKSHTTGAITYIDSASIATKGTSNDGIWRPYKATFLLQHPTAVLGDSIVLELKCVNSANVWIGIDDIAFSAEPFKLVPVTSVAISFANANDSLEVLKSAACTAVFTPSDASNQKVTWAVSDTTLATISSSGALTAKSVKTGIVKVRLTSQADPTKKDSISVLIYKTVATS